MIKDYYLEKEGCLHDIDPSSGKIAGGIPMGNGFGYEAYYCDIEFIMYPPDCKFVSISGDIGPYFVQMRLSPELLKAMYESFKKQRGKYREILFRKFGSEDLRMGKKINALEERKPGNEIYVTVRVGIEGYTRDELMHGYSNMLGIPYSLVGGEVVKISGHAPDRDNNTEI